MKWLLFLPMSSTGPNTEESSTVLQFHLRVLNCIWHSLMPTFAPLLTLGIWSWYSWHSLVWPADSPFTWLHMGWAPIMYICGFLQISNPCSPKFLEKDMGKQKEIGWTFCVQISQYDDKRMQISYFCIANKILRLYQTVLGFLELLK